MNGRGLFITLMAAAIILVYGCGPSTSKPKPTPLTKVVVVRKSCIVGPVPTPRPAPPPVGREGGCPEPFTSCLGHATAGSLADYIESLRDFANLAVARCGLVKTAPAPDAGVDGGGP